MLQIENIQFVFGLVMFNKLLKITKSLSDALQCTEIDLSAVSGLVTASMEELETCTGTQCWATLWEKCIEFANDSDIPVAF